jgi:hypothetical protein
MIVKLSDEAIPEGFVRATRIKCPVGLLPKLDHIKDNEWELSFVNKDSEKVLTRSYYWDTEQTDIQNKQRILLIFHRMNDSIKN